ncbi:putative N-acetyltransferase [Staphylococcus piscifermentans]|uniref:Putative phosphinothricin acetyltransferase YwnH n=1 Tax=Staphylococcus piscifermentans TaxID=70258 RepID=A0A239UER5_9STAP|nr:GNAT family N-acetyltransferase [Staphylococcus piscifermentans]RTX84943.1 N-acetyltransferase [Staphylococcus piscifermentans]GEP85555.1 putative phosphinothricin acetyltransferase YwnH [Staphylococcus piscifermentans]SNV08527.1 putative N-acetyltransferase [Staphylococcus piscifermentans]
MVLLKIAEKEDLPLFTKVYNQAIHMRNVTADIEEVTEAQMASIFSQHDTSRPLYTILNDQEQAIGYASLNHFYGRPAYDETAELSIYLDEQTRGQGYGTKVMQLLEQEAASLNIHYLTGYVFAQNIPCNKLFEKQGYSLWGNLPQIAHIDEKRLDLNIWGKQI